MLVPEGSAFPFDHYVDCVVEIEPIDINLVGNTRVDSIEVTIFQDTYRRFIPGAMTVYSHSGEVILRESPEVANLAIQGGGRFWRVLHYGLFGCDTEEESSDNEDGDRADWNYDY